MGVVSGLEVLENYRVCVSVFLVGGVLRRLWWLDVEPDWVPQSLEEVRESNTGIGHLITRNTRNSPASTLR